MTIMHKLAEDAKLAEEKRSELQELEAKKRADEYNMMQIMMTLIRGIQEPDKPTSPPAALSCNTGGKIEKFYSSLIFLQMRA